VTDRLIAWGPAAMWAAVLFFLSAIPGLDRFPVVFRGEDLVFHCASDLAADTAGVLLGYWITSAILARGAPIGGAVPLPPNHPGSRPE
jgi:hypothetical protein